VINLKKIVFLILMTMILAGLTGPAAYSKNDEAPQLDRGKVLISIPYGKNYGEISGPSTGAGMAAIDNPSCFTVDSAENILITDAVAGKILKVSRDEKKATEIFNYKKSVIGSDYVSNIAVSNSGFIYLADAEANRCVKFSQDGRELAVLGEEGRGKSFSKIQNIFTDDSSAVLVIDSLAHRISIFDDNGKFTGEVKLPISKMIFSYETAADISGNLYISSLKDNTFKIMRADKTSEVIFSHTCDPRDLGAKIVNCHLIGFDEKENAYLNAAVIGDGKTSISHYLVKFEKGRKEYRKIKIPAPPKEASRVMARPYMLLRENVIVSYASDAKEFKIVKFEF